MHFATGAKLQIINESNENIENLFLYIDYELTYEVSGEDVNRFHARRSEENHC